MFAAMVFGIASMGAAVHRSIALSRLYEADSVRIWFSQRIDFKDKQCPLRSSIVAQQLLDLPLALQKWAGVMYLVGVGVYLGLIWHDDIPSISAGITDNRHVFMFSCSSCSVCYYQCLHGAAPLISRNLRSEVHNQMRNSSKLRKACKGRVTYLHTNPG